MAREVAAWRARPFAYGLTDCFQFIGDWVLALTGTDYRLRFPAYASPRAAVQILRAHGGVEGILTACLGAPKHPAQAFRGDVVAGKFGRGRTLVPAGCLGLECVCPGATDLLLRRTADAVLAWTV